MAIVDDDDGPHGDAAIERSRRRRRQILVVASVLALLAIPLWFLASKREADRRDSPHEPRGLQECLEHTESFLLCLFGDTPGDR